MLYKACILIHDDQNNKDDSDDKNHDDNFQDIELGTYTMKHESIVTI